MSSRVLNIEVKIVYKTNLSKEEKKVKAFEILNKLEKTDESIDFINITIPSSGEIFYKHNDSIIR